MGPGVSFVYFFICSILHLVLQKAFKLPSYDAFLYTLTLIFTFETVLSFPTYMDMVTTKIGVGTSLLTPDPAAQIFLFLNLGHEAYSTVVDVALGKLTGKKFVAVFVGKFKLKVLFCNKNELKGKTNPTFGGCCLFPRNSCLINHKSFRYFC